MLKKINILNNNIENSDSYTDKQKEIIDLNNKIAQWKEKAKNIQAIFDFILPNYIIDEIIEKGQSIYQNHENLYCLINCAVINNRITTQNAKKIKEFFL